MRTHRINSHLLFLCIVSKIDAGLPTFLTCIWQKVIAPIYISVPFLSVGVLECFMGGTRQWETVPSACIYLIIWSAATGKAGTMGQQWELSELALLPALGGVGSCGRASLISEHCCCGKLKEASGHLWDCLFCHPSCMLGASFPWFSNFHCLTVSGCWEADLALDVSITPMQWGLEVGVTKRRVQTASLL